jgi:hypothetical protein
MSTPILEIRGVGKRFGFFGSALARGPAAFAGIDTARSKKHRRTSREFRK